MIFIIAVALMLAACSDNSTQPSSVAESIIAEATTTTTTTTTTLNIPTKNKVLNGAMLFDQNKQGGVYTSSAEEIYSLDQWRFSGAGLGQFTVQQNSINEQGFTKSLKVVVTTQQSAIAAKDNHHIEYPIEGRDMKDMFWGTSEAKSVTLSFLVRASKAGSKPFAIMNGINNRSYTTTYYISQPDTWTQVQLQIPGDMIGAWTTNEWTFGLKLLWSLGVADEYSATSNTDWHTGSHWNIINHDQLILEPAGSYLELTGVQFELGDQMTDFDHLDSALELSKLKRYYKKENGVTTNTRLGGN